MEMPLPEIIDRISILKLKIERVNVSLRKSFEREMQECEKAIEEFRNKGIIIKQEWIDKLYEINGFQWNLESEMNNLRKAEKIEEMGKIYLDLQISNKKRVAVKNQISEETGSGFRDIKVN